MGMGFLADATAGPIGLVDGVAADAGSEPVTPRGYRRGAAVGLDGFGTRRTPSQLRRPRLAVLPPFGRTRSPPWRFPPMSDSVHSHTAATALAGAASKVAVDAAAPSPSGARPARARRSWSLRCGGGLRRHGCTRRRRSRPECVRRFLGRREHGPRLRRCARPRARPRVSISTPPCSTSPRTPAATATGSSRATAASSASATPGSSARPANLA